jgi:hexulose-6-phosphate isomerase
MEVGANTVLIVPAVVTEMVTYEEAWKRSKSEISEIRKFAEEKQILIAIENVWNKFLLSPIEFRNYLDEFESDYIAAYFDVGNIALYGYPQHWIRTLGKRIKKIHVKGFDSNKRIFTYIYKGTIDWIAVIKALEDIGYNDYVTAELPINLEDPEGNVQKISRDLDMLIDGL